MPEDIIDPYTIKPSYVVYEIACVTPNHYYVGYTGNYERRMHEHSCNEGAQFTRRHKVKSKRIVATMATIEEAKRVEREWKQVLKRRGHITQHVVVAAARRGAAKTPGATEVHSGS